MKPGMTRKPALAPPLTAQAQAAVGGPGVGPSARSASVCLRCRMGLRFGSSLAGGMNFGSPSSAIRTCH